MKFENFSKLKYATVAVEVFLREDFSVPDESLDLLRAAVSDMKYIYRNEAIEPHGWATETYGAAPAEVESSSVQASSPEPTMARSLRAGLKTLGRIRKNWPVLGG